MNGNEEILKKLHVVTTKKVFDMIYNHGDMDKIDNIITNLLMQYYEK